MLVPSALLFLFVTRTQWYAEKFAYHSRRINARIHKTKRNRSETYWDRGL